MNELPLYLPAYSLMSSELVTYKTVQARVRPCLEPFSVGKPCQKINSFHGEASFVHRDPSGNQVPTLTLNYSTRTYPTLTLSTLPYLFLPFLPLTILFLPIPPLPIQFLLILPLPAYSFLPTCLSTAVERTRHIRDSQLTLTPSTETEGAFHRVACWR